MYLTDIVKDGVQAIKDIGRKIVLPAAIVIGGLNYTAPEVKAQTITLTSINQSINQADGKEIYTFNGNFSLPEGVNATSGALFTNFYSAFVGNDAITQFNTVEDLVAEANPKLSLGTSGWNATLQADGSFNLSTFGGTPGLDYGFWNGSNPMPFSMTNETDAYISGLSFSTTPYEGGVGFTFSQGSNYLGGVMTDSLDPLYANNFTLHTNASAVPEPSTYAALLGLGALGFAAFRRKRQTPSPSEARQRNFLSVGEIMSGINKMNTKTQYHESSNFLRGIMFSNLFFGRLGCGSGRQR